MERELQDIIVAGFKDHNEMRSILAVEGEPVNQSKIVSVDAKIRCSPVFRQH